MSFLPSHSKRYLEDRAIAFREVEDGATRGVILNGFKLPVGKFQTATADILIILPPGFPDVRPDMFFANPRLVLASGQMARATSGICSFAGVTWQQWSRHNDEWRPGVDNLWTMIKRVEEALEAAAP